MQNYVIIVKKNLEIDILKKKSMAKLEIIVIIQGNIVVLRINNLNNLKYSVPKRIPIVLHNGLNYDYHFIIKELAEEFKKQFTCLRENTEKYMNFTVPIKKGVTRNDKNGEEIVKLYILHITSY